MSILECILVALAHFLPKATLVGLLTRRLTCRRYIFQPYFSARVALLAVAQHVRAQSESDVALYPDYVCNIVPEALRSAGWRPAAYVTGPRLETDWAALLTQIDGTRAGLVVGASVFGSAGLLDLMNNADKVQALRARSVSVVFDIAQDVGLIQNLPDAAADLAFGIVSFNDKSFPGAMGGGVLAASTVPAHTNGAPTVRQTFRLYRLYLGKQLRRVIVHIPWSRRQETSPSRFDYSMCTVFPYEIAGSDFAPCKVQYAAAIVGTYLLPFYRRRKRRLIDGGIHLPTSFASTAPYLVVVDRSPRDVLQLIGMRARKQPYAVEGDPNSSLRPQEVIVHNKGFADCAV